MKRSEGGFTLIGLLVSMAIVALITGAATTSIFQVFNVTTRSSDHVTVIRQVQNAGYWISQDAMEAEHVIVDDDPATPEFLILNWTEWGYDEDSIYHVVTYSFQDLSEGIGKLMRNNIQENQLRTSKDFINQKYCTIRYIQILKK